MRKKRRKVPTQRRPVLNLYNALIILGSLLGVCLLALTRWPGMVLEGFGPNWFVIWLVVWCIDRTLLQAVLAGLCLGWLQDSLSYGGPSHAISMIVLSISIHTCFQYRFWKSDGLIAPLIVLIAVAVHDGILSLLLSLAASTNPIHTWQQQSSVFWISPLLSALWTPAFVWPLRHWWSSLKKLQN